MPGPPGAPRGGVLPPGPPLVLLLPNRCLLVQKKSPKSFAAFGLRLVLIFCEVKNKQKRATGTGHYVNRLVPKNDIKLLVNVYKTCKIDNITAWNNKKNI